MKARAHAIYSSCCCCRAKFIEFNRKCSTLAHPLSKHLYLIDTHKRIRSLSTPFLSSYLSLCFIENESLIFSIIITYLENNWNWSVYSIPRFLRSFRGSEASERTNEPRSERQREKERKNRQKLYIFAPKTHFLFRFYFLNVIAFIQLDWKRAPFSTLIQYWLNNCEDLPYCHIKYKL